MIRWQKVDIWCGDILISTVSAASFHPMLSLGSKASRTIFAGIITLVVVSLSYDRSIPEGENPVSQVKSPSHCDRERLLGSKTTRRLNGWRYCKTELIIQKRCEEACNRSQTILRVLDHPAGSSHHLPVAISSTPLPFVRFPPSSTDLCPFRRTMTPSPLLIPFRPPPGGTPVFFRFLSFFSPCSRFACSPSSSSLANSLFNLPGNFDGSVRAPLLPLILAFHASVVCRICCSHSTLCNLYSAIAALESVT